MDRSMKDARIAKSTNAVEEPARRAL